MLFFLVMAVASGILLAYSALTFDANAVLLREAGLRYAASARAAVLRSTLDDATYVHGVVVMLGTVSVERWLLEQLVVREAGVPATAFEEGNARVWDIVRSAVRPDYGFALMARTDAVTVVISSSTVDPPEIPVAHYDSSWTYALPTDPLRSATISLLLWAATS